MGNGRMKVVIYDHLQLCSDEQLKELKGLDQEMVIFYQKMVGDTLSLINKFPGWRLDLESERALASHQKGLDKYKDQVEKIDLEINKRNN